MAVLWYYLLATAPDAHGPTGDSLLFSLALTYFFTAGGVWTTWKMWEALTKPSVTNK